MKPDSALHLLTPASAEPDSFEAVLASYLEATERGQAGEQETWLTRYPQWSDALRAYFNAESTLQTLTLDFPATRAPQSGQKLGPYQLLEVIGQGGMGIVWKARHARLDRLVALKVLGDQQGWQPRDWQRFKNEAMAVSSLDHPNIVPVFDYGEYGGQQFLAMKLIAGCTLTEWRQRPTWGERVGAASGQTENEDLQRKIADIMMQVATAIHHAHQRGVLHRDLKPSNILIDEQECPFVVDFGLAKQLDATLSLTHTGAFLGTPSYMAPETVFMTLDQESGSAPEFRGGDVPLSPAQTRKTVFTTAVDIYGLGATLYFLLTGQAPVRSKTFATALLELREGEPVAVRTLNPAVDRDLAAICHCALAKNPRARYESAGHFAQDLQNWLAGRPITAREPTLWERARLWSNRNKVWATALSLALAGLIFGMGALIWGLWATTVARDEALRQRQQALQNLLTVWEDIKDLENLRPDLEDIRLDLMHRLQDQLAPMLKDPIHGTQANETNFWLEVDMGDLVEYSFDSQRAQQHYERAMKIAEELQQASGGQHWREVSYGFSHLADAAAMQGDTDLACQYLRECMSIRMKQLAKDDSIEARADLAQAHLRLSLYLFRQADATANLEFAREGAEYAKTALEEYRQLVVEAPREIWHARYFCMSCEYVAENQRRLGNWQVAFAALDEGLIFADQAKVALPEYSAILDLQRVYLLQIRSLTCWWCGRFEMGTAAAEQSLEILRALTAFSPRAVNLFSLMVLSYDLLAQNHQGCGNFGLMIEAFHAGLELGSRFAEDRERMFNLRTKLAHCRDHWQFALVEDPEFDRELHRSLVEELIEAKKIATNSQKVTHAFNAIRVGLMQIDLYLLDGQVDLAAEAAQELLSWLDKTAKTSHPDLEFQRNELRVRLALCTSDPPNQVLLEIAERAQNPGILIKLQAKALSSGDPRPLAIASSRIAQFGGGYLGKWRAAEGLDQARRLCELQQVPF